LLERGEPQMNTICIIEDLTAVLAKHDEALRILKL
jgi:hypothetical protein